MNGYRPMIDRSTAPVLLVKPGGAIQDANTAALQLFGYTAAELQGRDCHLLLDLPVTITAYPPAGENNHASTGTRKNGERFYCTVFILIFKNTDESEMIAVTVSEINRQQQENELQRVNGELRELIRYMNNKREVEHAVIVKEMNDHLGQLATALKIDTDWLIMKITDTDAMTSQRVAHIETAIDSLLFSVRNIAANLRPSVLDDFGLNAAIEWLCGEFRRKNHIDIFFSKELDDTMISSRERTGLYRIIQETISLLEKCGDARAVQLRLYREEGKLLLSIGWEGMDAFIGIDSPVMTGFRLRAAALGGELHITKTPGLRTIITVMIPKQILS